MLSGDRLESVYLSLPAAFRRRIPPGLKTRLRDWLLPEWRRARSKGRGTAGIRRVRGAEARLWGGFSVSALAELEAVRNGSGPPKTVAQAAWTLARWHATRGDYAAALENIVACRTAHPLGSREKRQFLPEAKFLCLLGRTDEARALLAERSGGSPFDPSIALMRASTHRGPEADAEDEVAALAEINAVFCHFGFTPLAKHDLTRPLSIDNLATGETPSPASPGPRVTVIVPAYNCAATIGTALRGLAAQTWENLEVLVVDDCSTDETADVVADFCRGDPRFRLLRPHANGGSYPARNLALGQATGDFVTVHDSDDWSHPEKIRLQAEDLAGGETYNFSAWARTLPQLLFLGTAQATRTLISHNFSSHMIRRDALIAAGGWDHVRVTGDSEFVWRFEALAGRPKDAFRDRLLLPLCPMSFGRLGSSSLTGSEATHVLSIHHGVRREYREGADHWHAKLRRGEGREALGRLGAPRFPAPPGLRPERPEAPPLDILAIGDFNMLGGTFHSALAMIRAGLAAGLSCGILQYRRYDLDVTRSLNPEMRDFAWESGVRIVAPGEALRAETVILTHPPLLAHRMDRFPTLDHDHLAVVVNQMAERTVSGTETAYDLDTVRANLHALLGHEGVWVPISERVRRIMAEDPRYPPPHADVWTPLLDLEGWSDRPVHWRGRERERPVIGRHGRDHPLKWPAEAPSLRAAYCAGRPCDVRFLGGARFAAKTLGRWPANWTDKPYGTQDVRDFLADLDLFLHYPDRDYVEEFGRAPMEAMAVGVPVLLPPEFEPTFGPAAIYAEPEAVWPTVEALWHDEAAWRAQAEQGHAFVRATCGYDVFPGRLARLKAQARFAVAE
jgi:hypothetical protein